MRHHRYMTLLGAVLAGGQSRRFGSDKAIAPIDGSPMLARVLTALRAQCDALVVVGRDWPGVASAEDVPRPGCGPLGGLAGALAFAEAQGHEEVLTAGCDLPALPADLCELLAVSPAVVAGQPLLGRWPTRYATPLRAHLEQQQDRSMRGWIAASGARQITLPYPIANINSGDDLRAYLASRG